LKCPCCNEHFSLIEYIKNLFIGESVTEEKEEELPTYVTDRKGNLHPWYDKKLRQLHSKLLDTYKDFGKANTNKRYKHIHEIENLIEANTSFRPSIWMCDNIWNGDIFIVSLRIYTDGNFDNKTELEVKKVMKNGRMILSVEGDESCIKARDLLKVIEIVDNVDKFLMMQELVA